LCKTPTLRLKNIQKIGSNDKFIEKTIQENYSVYLQNNLIEFIHKNKEYIYMFPDDHFEHRSKGPSSTTKLLSEDDFYLHFSIN
jgi:hypothetical protein